MHQKFIWTMNKIHKQVISRTSNRFIIFNGDKPCGTGVNRLILVLHGFSAVKVGNDDAAGRRIRAAIRQDKLMASY